MRRFDSPDGRSVGVVIPCVGRGFKGRVLSLALGLRSSVGVGVLIRNVGICSMRLSNLLGQLPFRSLWVVGGDFNAEIGFKGIGEEGTLGAFAHGRRTRSGHQMMEWAQGEGLRSFF